MTTLKTQEQYIQYQNAAEQSQQIFVKQWIPEQPTSIIPIILFHDSLGCVTLWRDFPAQLAEATGRHVIAYDRWGFGKSSERYSKIDHPFIPLEAKQGFNAVIQALNLDQYILIGHSVGGGMAVCAAEQNPDACLAVVTIGAQAVNEKQTTEGVHAAKESFKDPVQLERLAKYHGTRAKWVLESWTETWLSEAYQGWTLEPNLKQLRCSLLAIHGELDEFGSVKQPQLMVDITSTASVCHIIAGAGHVPHKENPEAVLTVIQDFLMHQAQNRVVI